MASPRAEKPGGVTAGMEIREWRSGGKGLIGTSSIRGREAACQGDPKLAENEEQNRASLSVDFGPVGRGILWEDFRGVKRDGEASIAGTSNNVISVPGASFSGIRNYL